MYPILKRLYDSMQARNDAEEAIELAQSPVKNFTDQLSNGYNPDFQFPAKQKEAEFDIGKTEKLPDAVQDVIEQIQDAETIGEKSAIAHNFANSYIKAENQGFLTERSVSLQDLANDPRGDCDDFVRFKMGLLIHGGVDPEHMFSVIGMAEYETTIDWALDRKQVVDDKSISPTGHAVLIVQDEDGQYLLLDNNLEGTPFFDPANPIVTDKLVGSNPTNNAFFDAYQSTTPELPLVGFVFDGNGTTVQRRDALIEMINAHNASGSQIELQPAEPEQSTLGKMDFN